MFMKQFISSAVVPSWLSIHGLGKSLGMHRTFLYLDTVTIPNNPMDCSWAAQVDNFYLRNPHLLKDLLHIFKQTLQPIYSKYTRKSP